MANRLRDLAGTQIETGAIPAAAAGDATAEWVIFEAPFAVVIESVRIIPSAAITGADSNSANLNLINRGTAGAGTTELANRDYASGTDEAKAVARALYAPADGLSVAAGTVLVLQREKVGNGLALPHFRVVVKYRAN